MGFALTSPRRPAPAPATMVGMLPHEDEIFMTIALQEARAAAAEGEVPLGEASIIVVAAAPHRGAAFDAARYAIDEVTARAPIWKVERFADGEVWIGAPARTSADSAG